MIGNGIHGPKRAQGGKHARISAQNLSAMAKQLGRCGDVNSITGLVCVTQPHDEDDEHMAIQIGGPRDGFVYGTWGGRGRNELMPKTKDVPTDV